MNKRSPMLIAAFARYTRWYLQRNFNAVRCSLAGRPETLAEGRSAIVYLNHPSWWDPLICLQLAMHFWPHRQHFAPIDAKALRHYPMLDRLGFFAVERTTRRGVMDFLRTGSAILQQPNAMLWITAEGEFTDPRDRQRSLSPGFIHLARRTPGVAVLPLALEYPFWNERRAEALCRFSLLETMEINVAAETLRQMQDRLQQEAVRRNPLDFETVLQGRGGVQPVYDAMRFCISKFRGESFSRKHGKQNA